MVAQIPVQQKSEEPKEVRLVVERELKVHLEELPEDLQRVYLEKIQGAKNRSREDEVASPEEEFETSIGIK